MMLINRLRLRHNRRRHSQNLPLRHQLNWKTMMCSN